MKKKKVKGTCECGNEFIGTVKRRYCDDCLTKLRSTKFVNGFSNNGLLGDKKIKKLNRGSREKIPPMYL